MSENVPGAEKAAQTFRVRIGADAVGFPCRSDQTVLQAMREAGIGRLPVGCRGGGCGVCRVQVTQGLYRTGAMSAACVTAQQAAVGIALACRVHPLGDMVLLPAPLQRGKSGEVRAA